MREDEVYVNTKALLRKDSWKILGGQPPSGCDHFPVIEIKTPIRSSLGSKGAFKPDLLAYKRGMFLIVECKPTHSPTDAAKLRSILSDKCRLSCLYDELVSRNILNKHQLKISVADFPRLIHGALAHGGAFRRESDLYVLHVPRDEALWKIVKPTAFATP